MLSGIASRVCYGHIFYEDVLKGYSLVSMKYVVAMNMLPAGLPTAIQVV
jgi:hypothetical protein